MCESVLLRMVVQTSMSAMTTMVTVTLSPSVSTCSAATRVYVVPDSFKPTSPAQVCPSVCLSICLSLDVHVSVYMMLNLGDVCGKQRHITIAVETVAHK